MVQGYMESSANETDVRPLESKGYLSKIKSSVES